LITWTQAGPAILASFLASLVECVEALTVVLAVGSTRGWRFALIGVGAALLLLAVFVAVVGPLIASLPMATLRLGIGALMLLFGLRWLRKAILRSAGVIPLHDENSAYRQTAVQLQPSSGSARAHLDPVAFMASFNITLLEGIEVVFIIIAIATHDGSWWPATIGALGALLVVVALGIGLHRPLAQVPENTLKFCVGVMLSGLGTFWVGEGIPLDWPGGDWAVPALILGFCAIALVIALLSRRVLASARPVGRRIARVGESSAVRDANSAPRSSGPGGAAARALVKLGSLFIDDRELAVGVIAWLAIFRLGQGPAGPAGSGACALFVAGLCGLLGLSALRASFAAAYRAA
jgi:Ca2+/H+ antiporter, TMEM165/GDT1 family